MWTEFSQIEWQDAVYERKVGRVERPLGKFVAFDFIFGSRFLFFLKGVTGKTHLFS